MTNVSQLKNLTQKRWFYPVVLLLIGFITYGYVLTSLGYYWADWEIVMFTKLNQALQFRFYAHDRPFPWTYHLLYFLLGSKPVGWHVATLLIRWAGVLFFVQALILVWPRYKNHMYWLGVLLLVYPRSPFISWSWRSDDQNRRAGHIRSPGWQPLSSSLRRNISAGWN
jgi:hypothetical protein